MRFCPSTSPSRALSTKKVRVYEGRERFGLGNQLGDQLNSLAPQLDSDKGHPGEVAGGTGETGDQAFLDRVTGSEKDDRDQ
jgi:hypothetical protein